MEGASRPFTTNRGCLGQSTLAIQGFAPELWPWRPTVLPLVTCVGYEFEEPTVKPDFIYERNGNPTRSCLQKIIAAMEGAEHALCFSSGMAAFLACIHLLNPGDGIVSSDQIYGGVQKYMNICSESKGLDVTYVDLVSEPENIRAALKPNTKMVFLEIYCNPCLHVIDFELVSKIVTDFSPDIIQVVDNTMLTPCLLKPLPLGATIIMHSITKYMAGHGDVLMGCLVTNRKDLHEKLRDIQCDVGLMASPFNCYLVERSLKTLPLRMRQHCSNALAVAQYLECHAAVEKVFFPGLPSHPQHERAKGLLSGFGGMVSLVLAGDKETTQRFLTALKLFVSVANLGSVQSIICIPWYTTHSMLPEETRQAMGLSENFLRISVGIEDVEDLLQDLKQALEYATQV